MSAKFPRGGGGGAGPFLARSLVQTPSKVQTPSGVYSPGGGGGTQHLPFTQKKDPEFQAPQKIFEILATPKNIKILYLGLIKDPRLHRNDP